MVVLFYMVMFIQPLHKYKLFQLDNLKSLQGMFAPMVSYKWDLFECIIFSDKPWDSYPKRCLYMCEWCEIIVLYVS